MSEIVNLRRARKAKARIDREKQAEQNRLQFGRTRTERQRGEAEARIAARQIEGHRRED